MRHAIAGAILTCVFSSAALSAASVNTNAPFERHATIHQPTPTVVASNALPLPTANAQPITLASAAVPGEASEPRAKTELALKCWLGLVGYYKGCWKSVCGDNQAGPVESVEYLGTAAGTDIYQVRYRYRTIAAYRVVPDPKGTATAYLVKATDPYWIKREISPRVSPTLIYTRPEHAPPVYCGGGFADFSAP